MKNRAKGFACRQPDPYRVPRKLRQRSTVKIVPVKSLKTSQNMQSKTQLIVVLLGSIGFGLLSFFGYSPDPKIIGDTINYADQAKEAISMKNWIALATVLISFGALVFAWWKGRASKNTLSTLLVLAAFCSLLSSSSRSASGRNTASDQTMSSTNKVKIEILKPQPRFVDSLRC